MSKTDNDRRIERLSRQSARIVIELRRDGFHLAAEKFEAAAIEAVELVRKRAV